MNKDMGVPLASARHSLDEMTPVVSHPLRNLTPQQENLARKLAARKRPAALISQQKLTMIGGDNQAESQFSAVKRMMRKQNLLGRTSPSDVDFAVLATERLRKEPGLNTVLRALALYRQARVRELGHGPKDFCNPDTDNAWLKL